MRANREITISRDEDEKRITFLSKGSAVVSLGVEDVNQVAKLTFTKLNWIRRTLFRLRVFNTVKLRVHTVTLFDGASLLRIHPRALINVLTLSAHSITSHANCRIHSNDSKLLIKIVRLTRDLECNDASVFRGCIVLGRKHLRKVNS